jgi:hypothetical protein
MPDAIPERIPDDNVGDTLSGGSMQGNVAIEGGVVAPVRFEGQTSGLLMALLMGASNGTGGAGATTPEIVEAGIAFKHYMDFQASSDGLFCTLVIDKNLAADETYDYTTCKVTQVELAHANSKLQGTFNLIAHSLLRDGTVNGDTEIGAVTHATDGLLAIFQQVELRLTEVTGSEDNLDSADELNVTEAKITINRNIAGEFESGSNAGYVGEPDVNGFPEAMLEFTVQDYKAGLMDTLIKDYQAIQDGREPKIYKAELFWTGKDIPTTAASNKYSMRFMLPALVLETSPGNAPSPGAKAPVTFTMKVQTPQAASLPDGTEWSWATAGAAPIRYLLQNGNALSILA